MYGYHTTDARLSQDVFIIHDGQYYMVDIMGKSLASVRTSTCERGILTDAFNN
jgi:hypothetical protein